MPGICSPLECPFGFEEESIGNPPSENFVIIQIRTSPSTENSMESIEIMNQSIQSQEEEEEIIFVEELENHRPTLKQKKISYASPPSPSHQYPPLSPMENLFDDHLNIDLEIFNNNTPLVSYPNIRWLATLEKALSGFAKYLKNFSLRQFLDPEVSESIERQMDTEDIASLEDRKGKPSSDPIQSYGLSQHENLYDEPSQHENLHD